MPLHDFVLDATLRWDGVKPYSVQFFGILGMHWKRDTHDPVCLSEEQAARAAGWRRRRGWWVGGLKKKGAGRGPRQHFQSLQGRNILVVPGPERQFFKCPREKNLGKFDFLMSDST